MTLERGLWVTVRGNRWDYRGLAKVVLSFYRWTLDLLGARSDPRYLQDMLTRSDLIETFDDETGLMLLQDNNSEHYRSIEFQAGEVKVLFDPQPGIWGYADENGRPVRMDSPNLNRGVRVTEIFNQPKITICPGSRANVSWLLMTLQQARVNPWLGPRIEVQGYDESQNWATIVPSPKLLLSRGPIQVRMASQAQVAFLRLKAMREKT